MLLLSEKIIPRNIPNKDIAAISSRLDAAMTSVEIPLSSPKPRSLRESSDGTTTAGETAAKTQLQFASQF
jgi:hypothetical protein